MIFVEYRIFCLPLGISTKIQNEKIIMIIVIIIVNALLLDIIAVHSHSVIFIFSITICINTSSFPLDE